MDADYWHDRWQHGDIGWHRSAVMPLLQKHWSALQPQPHECVLVPLCGKSLDMAWLAAQGHPVLGIELSALAIEAFFAEQDWLPTTTPHPHGVLHRAHGIALLQADAFSVDAATLADCTLAYDRGAFIALPPALRHRYATTVYARLPKGCRVLLITLEYPQIQKSGPPFSVEEEEVRALLQPQWQVDVLERRDILADQPSFAAEGVTALATVVYRLTKRD